MLKKVITAKLNSENLVDAPVKPSEADIAKKAELLEKAKTAATTATKEEKVNDDQVQSESTN